MKSFRRESESGRQEKKLNEIRPSDVQLTIVALMIYLRKHLSVKEAQEFNETYE